MNAARASREAKSSGTGHVLLAQDDRGLGLVAADFLGRQAVDLVREDQPPVGFVDEEIGTEVGDVAAGFEPDGRDADVARNIVAAARLQSGDESEDAAAAVAHIVEAETPVVRSERDDEMDQGEIANLGILADEARKGTEP